MVGKLLNTSYLKSKLSLKCKVKNKFKLNHFFDQLIRNKSVSLIIVDSGFSIEQTFA